MRWRRKSLKTAHRLRGGKASLSAIAPRHKSADGGSPSSEYSRLYFRRFPWLHAQAILPRQRVAKRPAARRSSAPNRSRCRTARVPDSHGCGHADRRFGSSTRPARISARSKAIMLDVDQAAASAYAVLSFGGFPRHGQQAVRDPMVGATLDADEKAVRAEHCQGATRNARRSVDKDHWPSMADTSWATTVAQGTMTSGPTGTTMISPLADSRTSSGSTLREPEPY